MKVSLGCSHASTSSSFTFFSSPFFDQSGFFCKVTQKPHFSILVFKFHFIASQCGDVKTLASILLFLKRVGEHSQDCLESIFKKIKNQFHIFLPANAIRISPDLQFRILTPSANFQTILVFFRKVNMMKKYYK